jgi:hypothetical protein
VCDFAFMILFSFWWSSGNRKRIMFSSAIFRIYIYIKNTFNKLLYTFNRPLIYVLTFRYHLILPMHVEYTFDIIWSIFSIPVKKQFIGHDQFLIYRWFTFSTFYLQFNMYLIYKLYDTPLVFHFIYQIYSI